MRDGLIRKGLVIFQFVLSMVLIIGTIVIYRQLQYIQTNNPGYNVSQVMSMQIPYKTYGSLKEDARETFFASMKQELQSQSSIAAVCTGGYEIVNVGSASSGNADWDGRDTTYNPTIAQLSADADFQKMFQLQLKSGHWFKPGNEDLHNYILNETAAAQFNMHQPVIGQRFTWGGDTGQVIGIVKDFHYKSMHEKIGPMVLSNNKGSDSYFFIKTVPEIFQKQSVRHRQYGQNIFPMNLSVMISWTIVLIISTSRILKRHSLFLFFLLLRLLFQRLDYLVWLHLQQNNAQKKSAYEKYWAHQCNKLPPCCQKIL